MPPSSSVPRCIVCVVLPSIFSFWCFSRYSYFILSTCPGNRDQYIHLCSDGTWALEYVGYHIGDISYFLNKQLKSGQINIKTKIAVFVEFRSKTQNFYINSQLITSNVASDLQPTIVFSNDKGTVLYSNFSFVPRTQQ